LDDASDVQITPWRGGRLVVPPLEPTGSDEHPGEHRTTVPLHGTWKTLLRVHGGRALTAVPVHPPEDAGGRPATTGRPE
jgi:hypothetical protein